MNDQNNFTFVIQFGFDLTNFFRMVNPIQKCGDQMNEGTFFNYYFHINLFGRGGYPKTHQFYFQINFLMLRIRHLMFSKLEKTHHIKTP